MKRLLSPFVLALTAILAVAYAYLAWRLARGAAGAVEPGGRAFFVPGNHEYYSGAAPWIAHFKTLGFRALLNEPALLQVRGAPVLVGGVVDPASGDAARPDLAASAAHAAFRLLLAHNPKLAPLGAAAGFDPAALRPHACGPVLPLDPRHPPRLYVSAGTGTWGPPVRFDSQPELPLIRLLQAQRWLCGASLIPATEGAAPRRAGSRIHAG